MVRLVIGSRLNVPLGGGGSIHKEPARVLQLAQARTYLTISLVHSDYRLNDFNRFLLHTSKIQVVASFLWYTTLFVLVSSSHTLSGLRKSPLKIFHASQGIR